MDVLRKAELSQQLLNSEMFKETISSLKAECYEVWRTSSADQEKLRNDMYFLNVALAQVESRLQSFVDAGKIEESNPKMGENS